MCWALSFPKKALPPRTAPWPDSQILQPKFNFQLLLTLERERKKQVRKVEECVRERGRERGREGVLLHKWIPTHRPAGTAGAPSPSGSVLHLCMTPRELPLV